MSTLIQHEPNQLMKDASDLIHHSKAAIAFSQDAVETLNQAKQALQLAHRKLQTLKGAA